MAANDLSTVLGSPRFRQLFTVRAIGQASDGLFQAALATFVLFSPERQASATAIAAAFAILYLPYSVIGPFAGVLLDRWSRRQVLYFGNLLRGGVVLVVCLQTASGHAGLDLGIMVLVALGINRFILAGLAAALPHTVDRTVLVTANAFAPTAGTLMATVGGLLGVLLRGVLGGGDAGSTAVLVVAAVGFLVSGLFALRMPRDLLGPDEAEQVDTIGSVIRGFGEGAVALWRARPAMRAVSIVALHRIVFGAVTVLVILLLRNTLNDPSNPEAALAQLTLVVGGVAGGALVGAVMTPFATRRMGAVVWSALSLIFAGVTIPIGLGIATVPALICGTFGLGLAGQSVKICADTAVQQYVTDDNRGRVFSLYDVLINVGLVVGVTAVAFTSPESGESTLDLVAITILLFVSAAWYLIRSRPISLPH